MDALKDTLQRMAKIANSLDKHGISLRFINHPDDSNGHFDKLTSPEEVMSRVSDIYPTGATNIGTVLNTKIVKPMIIDKAKATTLRKPVMVTIITDGEVSSSIGLCNQPRYTYNYIRSHFQKIAPFYVTRSGLAKDVPSSKITETLLLFLLYPALEAIGKRRGMSQNLKRTMRSKIWSFAARKDWMRSFATWK